MEKIKKIKINPVLVKKIFLEMKQNYKKILEDYNKQFDKKNIEKSFLKQRLFSGF